MHVDSNGLSGVGACAERENREGEGESERERERCSETTMMLVTCDGLYRIDACCVQRLAWLAHTNAFY